MKAPAKLLAALTAVGLAAGLGVAVTTSSQASQSHGGPTVSVAPSHLLRSGTASYTGNAACSGTLHAVVLNGFFATVTIKATVNGAANTAIWSGTAGEARHLNDTFGSGGVRFEGPLSIVTSFPNGDSNFFIYGDGNC